MQAIPSPHSHRPAQTSPAKAKPLKARSLGDEPIAEPEAPAANPGSADLEPHLEELCDMATD